MARIPAATRETVPSGQADAFDELLAGAGFRVRYDIVLFIFSLSHAGPPLSEGLGGFAVQIDPFRGCELELQGTRLTSPFHAPLGWNRC